MEIQSETEFGIMFWDSVWSKTREIKSCASSPKKVHAEEVRSQNYVQASTVILGPERSNLHRKVGNDVDKRCNEGIWKQEQFWEYVSTLWLPRNNENEDC